MQKPKNKMFMIDIGDTDNIILICKAHKVSSNAESETITVLKS